MGTKVQNFLLSLPHVHNTYFLLSLFGAAVSSILIVLLQQTSFSLASRVVLSVVTGFLFLFDLYSFFLFAYRSIYSIGPKQFDEREFTFPWRLIRVTDNLILTWLIYALALLNFWVYDTRQDKTTYFSYNTGITNVWEAWGALISTTIGLWAGVGFGDMLSIHWASRFLTGLITANGYLFTGLFIGVIAGLAIDYEKEKKEKKKKKTKRGELALVGHDSDDGEEVELRL